MLENYRTIKVTYPSNPGANSPQCRPESSGCTKDYSSRIINKSLEELQMSQAGPSNIKGDPFLGGGQDLSDYDHFYNRASQIAFCLDQKHNNPTATPDTCDDLILYQCKTVHELYWLVQTICNSESRELNQNMISYGSINYDLCKLLHNVGGYGCSNQQNLVFDKNQISTNALPDQKQNTLDLLALLVKFQNRYLQLSDQALRWDLHTKIMSQGIHSNNLPVLINRKFDNDVYALIQKLTQEDNKRRGLVSIQKIVTLTLTQNSQLVSLIDSIGPGESEDSRHKKNHENITLSVFTKLSHLANRYINMYQMSVNFDPPKSQPRESHTSQNFINETIPFGICSDLIELTHRLKTLEEVYAFMRLKSNRERNIFFAPDGSVFLDNQSEDIKGEAGCCIEYKNGTKQEFFLKFESDIRQYQFGQFFTEFENVDWTSVSNLLILIDHHTPHTYITPNSSAKTQILMPKIMSILEQNCFFNPASKVGFLIEPVRHADDDVALSLIIAQQALDVFAGDSPSNGSKIDGAEKYLQSIPFQEIVAVESIGDIFMGCPPPEHYFYNDREVLDFAGKYGMEPYITDFFKGFRTWPGARQRQAYNLLITMLIKTEIFNFFYGKIIGVTKIEDLTALTKGITHSQDQMDKYTQLGFELWLTQLITSAQNAQQSVQNFVDKRIQGLMIGTEITTQIRGDTITVLVIDSQKSQPEVAFLRVMQSIERLGNEQDDTSPVFFAPVIKFEGDYQIEGGALKKSRLAVNLVPESGVLLYERKSQSDQAMMSMFVAKIGIIAAHRLFSSIRGVKAQSVIKPEVGLRGGSNDVGTIVTGDEVVWFFELMAVETSLYLESLWNMAELKQHRSSPNIDFEAIKNAFFLKQELIKLYQNISNTDSLSTLTAYFTIMANTILTKLIAHKRLDKLHANFHTRIKIVEMSIINSLTV